jgi:serine/threonine protein kinase
MKPQRFGEFTLLRRIATGGTAEIFLARRHGVDGFVRHLAIKRVLPHLADNPDFVQLILDEARLAAHLHHAHIIEIHDVGVGLDGRAFIAMEYLPGIDLGKLVKAARTRRRRAVVILPDPAQLAAVCAVLEPLDIDVRAVSDPGDTRLASAEGPMDLLVIDGSLLGPTRDPLLAGLQADHPELLRTIFVGETGGRGFGLYGVVEPSCDPVFIAAHARAALKLAIPPELSLQLTRAVVDALDCAHRAHDFDGRPLEIVHRDVNPSNVLISLSGSIKLVDFGIARATTTLREEVRGNFVGTFAYMSPEQTSGGVADGRSDLFSVGSLLHELLTGVHPFRGETEFATMRAIRDVEPPALDALNPGLPPTLVDTVAGLLSKDPEERHPDARALLESLEGLVRRDGIDLNPKRLAGFLKIVYGDDRASFDVTTTGYAPRPATERPRGMPPEVAEPDEVLPPPPSESPLVEFEPVVPTPAPRSNTVLYVLIALLFATAVAGWWMYAQLAESVG